MANKTIAQVNAVQTVTGSYKIPISTGDSQAHTATVDGLKAYIRQGNVDWDEITNKPQFATVASTGSYNDLTDKPTFKTINNESIIGTGNITIQAGSADWDDITNKPTFANVAFSGDYTDLTNTPTIPAAPVQSNWNETNTSSLAYIQNKPTIPAAQVQSDWNQSDTTAVDYIKNKPVTPTVNDAMLTITQGGVQKGTFTANAAKDVTIVLDNGVAEQSIVTKTVTTDSLNVAANTVYKYTNALTALTISSIPNPADTTLESIIYFSTDGTSGCLLSFTNRPNYLFGATGQLMPGCHYVITIKDGCVSVSTPDYVEPWTVETLTFLDSNNQPVTKRFMIANN